MKNSILAPAHSRRQFLASTSAAITTFSVVPAHVLGRTGERPRLIPEKRNKEYQRPPKTLPRSIGYHAEWIKACKEGTPTASNFGFAGPLTEAVLLGSVCVHFGGTMLYWDSANMKITNEDEANALLRLSLPRGLESVGGSLLEEIRRFGGSAETTQPK